MGMTENNFFLESRTCLVDYYFFFCIIWLVNNLILNLTIYLKQKSYKDTQINSEMNNPKKENFI